MRHEMNDRPATGAPGIVEAIEAIEAIESTEATETIEATGTADRWPRRWGPGQPGRRTGPRTLVAAIVLILTIGSTFAVPPAAVLAHGRGANGCTGVPDAGYGFEFHTICDRHDRCYGSRPHGSGYHGRRQCDRAFLGAMSSQCDRHPRLGARRMTCRSVAWTYYRGVRAFGIPAWNRRSSPSVG